MAESKHNQIAEAIKARLEGIVGNDGATYWYTPAAVVRVQSYDRLLIDPSVMLPEDAKAIYALRAGEERHREESTGDATSGGIVAAEAEFFVLMYRLTAGSDDKPYGPDGSTKALEQNRMVRDFLRALWLDVTLGGLATNIVDGSLLVDRDTDVEKWAVAEARFTVAYTYAARTP